MTMQRKNAAERTEWTVGQLSFGFFALFCLLLFLRNPSVAISSVTDGLLLCAKTVIPSLFPFLVLSELIVSGGVGRLLLRPIERMLSTLFRMPTEGCCAILLGLFCGSPVGARAAVGAYDRGTLTKEQTERVLCASSAPSFAYLLNVVGTALRNDRRYGIILWSVTTLSALTIALFEARKAPHTARSRADLPNAPREKNGSGARFFSETVRSATSGILTVCAYVVFFSAFCGTLTATLETLSLPQPVRAAVFCLFELSGGVSAASKLPTWQSDLLTAFAVGWSGLSVHCQVLSICDGRGLHCGAYFRSKLLQAVLTATEFWLVCRIVA